MWVRLAHALLMMWILPVTAIVIVGVIEITAKAPVTETPELANPYLKAQKHKLGQGHQG